jgi:large subunit ribosomal protein L31
MIKNSWRKEKKMKTDIQPNYNVISIKCSTCGHEYTIGTTAKDYRIDTCANCHPFYTGTQAFVQAAGRVDRFNKRVEQSQTNKQAKDK